MRVYRRYCEHSNVIDLEWERLLRHFRGLMLDTSVTVDPAFSHFEVVDPSTVQITWDLQRAWDDYQLTPDIVWLDE